MDVVNLASEKERLMTSRDQMEMKPSGDNYYPGGNNDYRARSNSAVIGG